MSKKNRDGPFYTRGRFKMIGLVVIIVWGLSMYLSNYDPHSRDKSEQAIEGQYVELYQALKDNGVLSIRQDGSNLFYKLRSGEHGGEQAKKIQETNPNVIASLHDLLANQTLPNGEVPAWDNVTPLVEQSNFAPWIMSFGPMLLLVAVWVWFMRKSGGMGGAGAFGKSKAVVHMEDNLTVRFSDVYAPEAVDQLKEAVALLKNPKRFAELGGRMPRGVGLVGPPGTGKTLLAKAVAGEAGVAFFSLSGSDFTEMLVGVAAARVRDLFEEARKHAPCIIFVDEVDILCGRRSDKPVGGEKEAESGLMALGVELDGFENSEGVLFICATNRPENLDPSLLRPGRIDRIIELLNPDLEAREAIFKINMRKKPVTQDVVARDLARSTSGMNGSQLAAICNEAALIAGRKNKRVINMRDFEEAKDKILLGRENKGMIMTDEEKRQVAYHESGHAIIGFVEKPFGHDPVYKVSIIPRFRALGITMFLPERDCFSMSKRKAQAELHSLYGGRIAEELIYGPDGVCTGAQNDVDRATSIAENMIRLWDMAENPLLRHRVFATEGGGLSHLGGRGFIKSDIAEETAKAVDAEIRHITQGAYERAEQMIKDRMDILHVMAQALMKWETIGVPQIEAIMEGKSLDEIPPPVGLEESEEMVAGSVSQKAEILV